MAETSQDGAAAENEKKSKMKNRQKLHGFSETLNLPQNGGPERLRSHTLQCRGSPIFERGKTKVA
jgi:hypothetical protein